MLQPHFIDWKSGIWIGKLLVEDHVAKLKNGIQDYLNLEFLLLPGEGKHCAYKESHQLCHKNPARRKG